VALPLKGEDLGYWDEKRHGWVLERGQVQLMIGAASDDIRLTGKIEVR
jgi:beta-glucosidase